MTPLSDDILIAAQAHARRDYPNESCGLVVGERYVPCANLAADPTRDFRISATIWTELAREGPIRAVIHSHPDGPSFPSAADMAAQIANDVPWYVIPVWADAIGQPIGWGDSLPIRPMIGRSFVHGVADCYTLVRDAFRLGSEGLAAEDITAWPHAPLTLPEVPRDDAWWDGSQDLYVDHFAKFGFREISRGEVRPGDAFLMKIRSDKLNHAGLVVGNDLVLHHLPTRLSRREPAGIWARHADLWLRYEGRDA